MKRPFLFFLIFLVKLCRAASLNVTDYGAVGDAVQFHANTASNSAVITVSGTNVFSSGDIGKAIEVFGCGTNTSGTNFQDLVTTIANVVNGTNIYLNQTVQASLTNTFATLGTDNRIAFANAIAAASGTNTVINIPAGDYLFLTTNVPNAFGTIHAAIVLRGGGLHFVGAGTNNTALLSQGAWTLQGGAVNRGMLFAIGTPTTNDYPVSFENLTLDGGVEVGRTGNHGFPASVINGDGWDVTHDAIEVFGGGGNMFTQMEITNCLIKNWRGEMLKSTDGSTNGNLQIVNTAFVHGQATAINIYPALNVTNCYFGDLYETAEYYQAYSTNASYFQNNFVTNVVGALFAINGAVTNHVIQPFNLISNVWYFGGDDENGIQTTPAQNVVVQGNNFYGGGNAIVLGASGGQGNAVNSNFFICENVFNRCGTCLSVQNTVLAINMSSNIAICNLGDNFGFAYGYGWTTNSVFLGNVTTNLGYGLNSSAMSGQYYNDAINNIFPPHEIFNTTGTSVVNYAYGRLHRLTASVGSPVFVLNDATNVLPHIPLGAVLQLTNNTARTAVIYLSANYSASTLITNGGMQAFVFNGAAWVQNLQPSLTKRITARRITATIRR